jgi:long-chain fatty acid transport protein
MKQPILLFIVAWVLWLPSGLRAGGYFVPDRGVRAYSRGGAFLVGNDDLSAIWYNPAALAGQRGTRIQVDGALVFWNMEFQRYTIPEVGDVYQPIQNSAPPLPDPSLAVSSDFGLSHWTFAFSAYGPYKGLNHFSQDGSQRYSLVREDNLGYYLAVAAAWEPVDGFRIGLAPTLITLLINNTQAATAYSGIFGGPEQTDLDAYVQFIAKDEFVPTVMIGLWLSPGSWWPALNGLQLGFSLMPGVKIDARGSVRVRLPASYYYDGVTVDPPEPEASTSFALPWIVRAGVRYARPRFDLEFNVVWETWSNFETITVKPLKPTYFRNVPLIGDFVMLPLVLDRHYRDTVSLRLGGSVRPLDWLVLRLGGYYENGATADEYFTVACADADKWALGAGVGVVWGMLELDVGYMHVFQVDKDIQVGQSQARQSNLSNPEDTVPVGAGFYHSSYDLIGISALLRFSK